MKTSDDPLELEPVLDTLPVGFDALRVEALAEGFRQVERLAADWEAGTTRFDRDGEALLAARLNGVLAGIGGLTIEPVVPGALRMRRFYVRPAFELAPLVRSVADVVVQDTGSDRGFALEVPDHEIGIAADGDRALSRIEPVELGVIG